MAISKNLKNNAERRARGSGSKVNVGRKPLPYKVKRLNKSVPEDIHEFLSELVSQHVKAFVTYNDCLDRPRRNYVDRDGKSDREPTFEAWINK